MVKRGQKKISTGSERKSMTAKEREELLIENFVGLQHAMTNLSIKFEALSDNISNLLKVFEMAARNYELNGKGTDNELLDKVNSLIDQNKVIAKGLVLVEDKLKDRAGFSPRPMPQPLPTPQAQPIQRPSAKPLPKL